MLLLQVTRCKSYGARVDQYGQNIYESKKYATELAKREGLRYINGLVDFVCTILACD